MNKLLSLLLFTALTFSAFAQTALDESLPVRGLSIGVPESADVDDFVRFIDQELAPAHFNMLVLLVDWNYAYETHPELAGKLTKADVKKIVAVCRKHNITVAPQINLFGHQSWAKATGKLLTVYPQFDETPHINLAESKVLGNGGDWNDPDFFYCKSYCP
ncbi:MAG: glycoside hydrolase, partial [Prevotellaceae bacterium]|nr:glycoside hydrolase [Prevotellaceae bacterium]